MEEKEKMDRLAYCYYDIFKKRNESSFKFNDLLTISAMCVKIAELEAINNTIMDILLKDRIINKQQFKEIYEIAEEKTIDYLEKFTIKLLNDDEKEEYESYKNNCKI